MDLSEKDKFGLEKGSGDHLNYQASGLSAEWQFGNQSISMVPGDPSIAVCQGNQMGSSPCPSVSMVDSFGPSLWSHPTNSQSLGFCETNVQTSGSSSHSVPIGKPVPMPLRLDMGGVFLPTGPGVLPPSLSHFPTDSAFIERAARFSSFNGGSFSGMVSHFGTSESLNPYSNASRGTSAAQIQMSELHRTDTLNDAAMPVDRVSNSESPMKDQRDKGSLNGDQFGEPEFSGSEQEGTPNLGTSAGGAKKRKRTGQDVELDQGVQQLSAEATKEIVDIKQKAEQNSSTMAIGKPFGKQPKDNSDSPKEDYIHVRARRGQATNSHSLAERVRREKISERMKFLQDLVPGCSKVTGKAVMLDEIINYVQSLQQQVEFLSMKLAAVNPRLDFNIEGLLSKDFLQPRVGSSSTMGFSHDMIHPQLHLPQQGLIPGGMTAMAHPSDVLRRAINAQLTMINGYKEPTPQMPNAWDDELHNVIQMNFGTTNPPLNTQELNSKPRDGFPI